MAAMDENSRPFLTFLDISAKSLARPQNLIVPIVVLSLHGLPPVMVIWSTESANPVGLLTIDDFPVFRTPSTFNDHSQFVTAYLDEHVYSIARNQIYREEFGR